MSAFSIFTSKKRKTQKTVPTVEEYYLRLARRTTVIKFVIIMFLAGFTLFSFSSFKDDLTIENFRYVLKLINFGSNTNSNAGSAVYIDKDSSNKGEVLRGDLAVISNSGFSVYSFGGNKVFSNPYKYDNPKMITNSKNIIACDLGGYEVHIYSNNSLMQTFSYNYPVLGLSASENGPFAVISSEKGYRSGLFIYDEYFRVIYKYFSGDKYIDFVSLSSSGKEALALLHYAKDGSIVTLLMRFQVDSEQPVFQTEFVDEMPLGINFMSDNSYCIITSEAVRFFTSDNKLSKEIFFEEKSLLGYEFNRNYAIISYDASGLSSGTDVEVFRSDGSVAAAKNYSSSILDIKINGDKLYVLTHGSIAAIDLTGKDPERTDTVDSDFRQIIFNEQRVILLSDSRAIFLNTAHNSENNNSLLPNAE